MCCPLRQAAISASCCVVRVTDRQPSKPVGDTQCLVRRSGISFGNGMFFVSSSCCCVGGSHTHIWGRAAFRDSNGSEKISRFGCCFCESSGFCGDSWICEFQSSEPAWTHAQCFRVASTVLQVSPCSSWGRMSHTIDTRPHLCSSDCLIASVR